MSNNTVHNCTFQFLIVPDKESGYLGMCYETGFIEGGNTAKEVEEKLLKGVATLLKTVRENPKYEPSLNLGLPLKYRFVFYKSLILIALFALLHRPKPYNSFARDRADLAFG